MSIKRNGVTSKYTFLHNGNKLKKAYHNTSTVLWTAGDKVTYHVDVDLIFVEEVDDGTTCLLPTTFTPAKEGWIFVGWREDGLANSEVLSEKNMNGEPVVLYAVYKQIVTGMFISYDNIETVNGTRYYNASGDIVNATIIACTGAEYPNWTWRGWSAAGDAAADASLTNGEAIFDLTDNVTYYGLYQADVILTTVVNGVSTEYKKTKYYNAHGNDENPQFTITDPTLENYIFLGWSLQSSSEGVAYSSITDMILDSNMTVYAVLQPNIITVYDVTYDRGSIAGEPSVIENMNNSNYISSTNTIYCTIRGIESNTTQQDGNKYDSGTVTILNLTPEAKNNFKYAEVTIEYVRWCDGGGYSDIYVDGTSIADTTKEVVHLTYTWDLSEKTSCTARINTHNWSSNIYYWSGGSIGIKKVVLREWIGYK